MRSILSIAFTAPLLLFLAGCAGVDYNPYPATEPPPGSDVGGIVYYDDSPYLIIWPDGKGNVQWLLQFLPDQTKKRIAHPYNVVASLNASLNFNNGVLTQTNVTVDDTAVLAALTSAAQSVVPLIMERHISGPQARSVPVSQPATSQPAVSPNTADIWIFKIALHKDASNTYASFESANMSIVVPIQLSTDAESARFESH